MNQIPQKVSLLPLSPFHPPPPPAFSSFETLTHLPFTFQDFCLIFALPLYNAAENLSKLIEQSPDTVSTAYREVSLEESRQQTSIFCCTVGASCSMESFGTVKPFCAVMLWPGPKLSFSQVYQRTQLAGGCSVPFPPPQSLCISPAVWATREEEIFFLLLSVAFGPCMGVSANTRFVVSPYLTGGWFTMLHHPKPQLCVFGLAKWPSVHTGLCFLLLCQE